MIGKKINAAGLDWHVQQEGDGPDLVCIHGAGASLQSWDGLVPLLAEAFRVTRMDLPGHADTEAFPTGLFGLRRTARAVAALCETLEVESPVILGHSAGGAIAMSWWLQGQAPLPGRLLAINPALLPFSGVAGVMFPALAKIAAMLPLLDNAIASRARKTSEVQRLIEGTGSNLSSPDIARYQALMARPSHVRAVLEMMAGWRLDGLIDAWAANPLPLDILLGMKDRAVPPGKTAMEVGDLANYLRLAEVGHLAHEEAPAPVATWIREITGLNYEREHYG
ncbi:MAG: alpha/beta fold hydrolase BchO [Pseudomonadota bacterium]